MVTVIMCIQQFSRVNIKPREAGHVHLNLNFRQISHRSTLDFKTTDKKKIQNLIESDAQ